VWDAGTGEQKLVLHGHTQPVRSVAFRPGAEQAASSADGALETFLGRGFEIKQWDLAAGGEARTLYHRHGWSHTNVAFSPDGRRLLSTSGWGGFLRVWDPDNGKELEERRVPEHCVGLAVSSADGRVAFGGASNSLWLTAPQLGPVNPALPGHTGFVLATAFSPDGTRLASADEAGAIKVWSVADGREVVHFRGHTGPVTAVSFGRDGRTLASASEDGTAKVWEVPSSPGPFPMNIGVWVRQVRFSPDGRRIALSQFAGTWVADTATPHQPIFRLPPPKDAYRLAYSRDGRLLASCEFRSDLVRVWDAETGRAVATCRGHVGHLHAVAFGPGGLLASAGDDGTVRLWDAETGRPGDVLKAHEVGAFGVCFDPGGTVLATIGGDAAVRLWEVPAGRPLRTLGAAVGRLASVTVTDVLAFDPEGRRLAAACGDGTARVWEVATGEELHRLRGHTRAVTGVLYSPDGRRIVTGSEDHTIKLWDAATGDEVFTLRGHTGFVLGLAFSPDGKRLLSTSADGTVRDWDSTPRPLAPR
jgi:WD40 repeat protein